MIRRFLAALVVLSVAGAAAGCGKKSDSGTSGTASKGASAAVASPADGVSSGPAAASGTATNKEVCDGMDKVITDDSGNALEANLDALIAARKNNKKADEEAATKKVKSTLADWATKLRALAKTAAEPTTAATVSKLADSVNAVGTDEYLAKLKTTDDVSKMKQDIFAQALALGTICDS